MPAPDGPTPKLAQSAATAQRTSTRRNRRVT
jgi:hypothetical protein